MTNSLLLKVDVFGGSSIESAAGEACALANRLDITVEFEFNGVTCMAIPGGSSDVLVSNWNAADRSSRFPMASTHRRAVSATAEKK